MSDPNTQPDPKSRPYLKEDEELSRILKRVKDAHIRYTLVTFLLKLNVLTLDTLKKVMNEVIKQ
jgi:hypothetical protein